MVALSSSPVMSGLKSLAAGLPRGLTSLKSLAAELPHGLTIGSEYSWLPLPLPPPPAVVG